MTDLTYSVGDRVKVEFEAEVQEVVVNGITIPHLIFTDGDGMDYRVPVSTVIEHMPKPAPLPTEPGAYWDRNGSAWVRWNDIKDGTPWVVDGKYKTEDEAARFAPFTRLVPEGSERQAALREVVAFFEGYKNYDRIESALTEFRAAFVVE